MNIINGIDQELLAALGNTLAGSFDNLLGQVTASLLESLGNFSLGSLFGKRGEIADAFNELLNQAIGHLTDITSSLINVGLASIVASLQGKRGDLTDAFNEILNQALGHVTDIGTSLINVALATLLSSLQGKRGLLDDLLAQLSGAVSSVTGSLTQVGSDLLTAIQPHLQDLQDQLVSTSLTAAQSLLGTLAGISGTLQGKRGDLADAFSELLNQAVVHLQDIATTLVNVGLATLVSSLQGKRGLLDDLLAQLSGAVSSVTGSLTQVGSDLLAAVTPHLQDLQDQLVSQSLTAAQSLLATLAGISGTLQGKRGDVADAFTELFNQAVGHLTDIATVLVNTGLTAIVASLTGKRGLLDDLLAQLSGAVSSVTGSLSQLGSDLLVAVQPHLQDLQDQLVSTSLTAAQSLLGTLAGISGTLQG